MYATVPVNAPRTVSDMALAGPLSVADLMVFKAERDAALAAIQRVRELAERLGSLNGFASYSGIERMILAALDGSHE